MKQLPLYLDGEVVASSDVDDEIFDIVSAWRWHLRRSAQKLRRPDYRGFAWRSIDGRQVRLERWLTQADGGFVVSHVDGDTLNNQFANLRVISLREHLEHMTTRRQGSSPYRGVSWSAQYRRWVARASRDGEHFFLGRYEDEHEAAAIVRQWRDEHAPTWERQHRMPLAFARSPDSSL
jgi:hypothetical protein